HTRDQRAMPESLPRMNVREMHLDNRHARCRDGIANRDGGVRESARIEHDPAGPVRSRCVDSIDQLTFMITLEELDVQIRVVRSDQGLDVRERRAPIDLRLARTEEIQI